jgi:hypothetical protein
VRQSIGRFTGRQYERNEAMKKAVMGWFCCLCLIGNGFSEPFQASSANVMAVMRVDLPKDDLTLFSTSLINSNTINSLFSELPAGTAIYMWDVEGQAYRILMKTDLGWGASGTNVVKNGSGLFIRPPKGVQTSFTICGDVPLEESKTVFSSAGFALLSYPYPHNVLFVDTEMAKKAAVGDEISFWKNGWETYTKTGQGWTGADQLQLKTGQAFFYRSSQNTAYTETRPFTIQ